MTGVTAFFSCRNRIIVPKNENSFEKSEGKLCKNNFENHFGDQKPYNLHKMTKTEHFILANLYKLPYT